MYRARAIMGTAFASAACATAVYCNNSAVSLPRQSSSPTPPPAPTEPESSWSPLFARPPSAPSITLPASIPERSSPSLHPLLVVVVARHGARTPVNYLDGQSKAEFQQLWGQCHAIDNRAKLDRDAQRQRGRESEGQPLDLPRPEDAPLDEKQLIPCGRGQLTQQGERELTAVGQALRQRYVERDGFLPPTLTSPSLLYLRSTNWPRTRLSTARLVQGLYPELSLSAVRAMTVTRREPDEDLYPMYRYCDRLREIFHASVQQPLYKRYLDHSSLSSLQQQAQALLGTAPFDPKGKPRPNRSWIAMSDEVKCRQAAGLPLPNDMTAAMATRINQCAEFLFHSLLKAGQHSTEQRVTEEQQLLNDRSSTYNENLRLAIGRFVQSLLPPFRAALRGVSKEGPRLLVYGGHDSSIIPILSALGLDASLMGHWPPFGSYIVMELLQDGDTDDRFLRVVYNGRDIETMPYAEFERRVHNVSPGNYSAACTAKGHGHVPPQSW